MASDAAIDADGLRLRVRELLAAHDPAAADRLDFLRARFDAGLAWCTSRSAWAASAYCGAVAVRAAEECVQLHGGTGMTWEHPAHLYLKRAKADQIALGTPGRHRTALAALADLAAQV